MSVCVRAKRTCAFAARDAAAVGSCVNVSRDTNNQLNTSLSICQQYARPAHMHTYIANNKNGSDGSAWQECGERQVFVRLHIIDCVCARARTSGGKKSNSTAHVYSRV